MPTTDKLKQLERLAWILDSSIPIPGTPWKVGLDGLIGLVPGIGDLSAGVISSYILFQALRMGAPPMVIGRMALNIMLESVVGVIPVVGDLFDFAFKANQRNVALMRDYVIEPTKVKRRSAVSVLLVVGALLAVLVLLVWAMFALLSALISAFI